MNLKQDLILYKPWNEQEQCDKEVMQKLLEEQPDIFYRENRTAHFTASSWLLNKEHDKVLMIYHNIYHSWAWTGGHADGEENLLSVAIREAEEETGVTGIVPVKEDIYSLEILTVDGHEKRGISDVRPVSEEIFSLESLTVDGHVKKGRYVSSHLHLNVTYLLEADEQAVLRVKPDENSGVKWFSLEEALEACSEPWMIERVYKKLNQKLKGEQR